MNSIIVRLLKAAALALTAALSIGAIAAPKVGEMAPDFTLTLIDGTKVSSSDLRGNVVVLNFWATWCVPCRKELPLLDRYYGLQQKHGLKVYAITTESSLPIFKLKKLFAAMQIPSARSVTGPYARVRAVPTNYIIDRAGRLRYAKAAALDLDDLNDTIVPLLREPVPTR